jgi:hypothetical protein
MRSDTSPPASPETLPKRHLPILGALSLTMAAGFILAFIATGITYQIDPTRGNSAGEWLGGALILTPPLGVVIGILGAIFNRGARWAALAGLAFNLVFLSCIACMLYLSSRGWN